MNTHPKASWIAADWGTTNLRIWALDEAGGILAHRSSEKAWADWRNRISNLP